MNKRQTIKMFFGIIILGLAFYGAGTSYAQMNMDASGAEAPDVAIDQLNPVYDAYFDFQEALAQDKFTEAKSAMASLEENVNTANLGQLEGELRSEWTELKERLLKNAALGQEKQTIKELRTEVLKDLSETVLTLEKKFGHSGSSPHYEAFCPMALNSGASWLQKGEQIMNPFYGKNMQGCGEIKKEFSSRE